MLLLPVVVFNKSLLICSANVSQNKLSWLSKIDKNLSNTTSVPPLREAEIFSKI